MSYITDGLSLPEIILFPEEIPSFTAGEDVTEECSTEALFIRLAQLATDAGLDWLPFPWAWDP